MEYSVTKLRSKSQLNKTDKREQILESASKLFAKKNYHEVMMEDVSKEISIAKGTLYLYFKSKEDLYFSIVENRLQRLISSLNEFVHSSSNSIDALHSYVQHVFMFMCKYQAFFRVYWYQNIKPKNSVCNSIDNLEKKLKQILYGIIEEGKSENLFKQIETELAADIALGSIFTGVERQLNKQLSNEMKLAEVNRIYDFILGGLFSGFVKQFSQPLINVKIVLTRNLEEHKESAKILEAFGADVISFPTIAFRKSPKIHELEKFVLSGQKIDYLIFTSVTAAKYFNEMIRKLAMEEFYERVKIISIGNKTTAYCESLGLNVVFTPKRFSSKDFLNELKISLKGKKILLPHSSLSQQEISEYLTNNGAVVVDFELYENTLPEEKIINENMAKLERNKIHWIIFTSPSTFSNFIKIVGRNKAGNLLERIFIAAIGPTTAKAIEDMNYKVNLIPKEFSMEGITKALIAFYNKEKQNLL